MKRRNKAAKKRVKASKKTTDLTVYARMNHNRRQIEKLSQDNAKLHERVEESEIHINLLTRLVTTLCVEKLGMRIGVLKRLLKRIEKEAVRDSQIYHLESLYNLPHPSQKKSYLFKKPPKSDPWEDIS